MNDDILTDEECEKILSDDTQYDPWELYWERYSAGLNNSELYKNFNEGYNV